MVPLSLPLPIHVGVSIGVSMLDLSLHIGGRDNRSHFRGGYR